MVEQIVEKRIMHSDHETVRPFGFVANLIYAIFAILATLLFLRFVLSLAGANRSNEFANTVYDLSAPFVNPFSGLFNTNKIVADGNSIFEFEVLVALLVYALLASIIGILLRSFRSPDHERY